MNQFIFILIINKRFAVGWNYYYMNWEIDNISNKALNLLRLSNQYWANNKQVPMKPIKLCIVISGFSAFVLMSYR